MTYCNEELLAVSVGVGGSGQRAQRGEGLHHHCLDYANTCPGPVNQSCRHKPLLLLGVHIDVAWNFDDKEPYCMHIQMLQQTTWHSTSVVLVLEQIAPGSALLVLRVLDRCCAGFANDIADAIQVV